MTAMVDIWDPSFCWLDRLDIWCVCDACLGIASDPETQRGVITHTEQETANEP